MMITTAFWRNWLAQRIVYPTVAGSSPAKAAFSEVDQLVDHRAHNPTVAGSSPALAISCALGQFAARPLTGHIRKSRGETRMPMTALIASQR